MQDHRAVRGAAGGVRRGLNLAAGLALSAALLPACGGSSGGGGNAPPKPLLTGQNSASAGGVAIIQVGGVTKMYVPESDGTIAVLDAGKPLPQVAYMRSVSLTTPTFHVDQAAAVNNVTGKVVAIGYNHALLDLVDAATDTLQASINTGASTNVGFSGGSCIVCGLVVDQVNNRAIVSIQEGYRVIDLAQQKVLFTVSASPTRMEPAIGENFGYDTLTNQVLNAGYGGMVSLVDLSATPATSYDWTGTLPTFTEFDHAAIDTSTNVAVLTTEGNTAFSLMNLAARVTTGPTFTTPIVNVVPGASGRLDAVAVEPNSHFALLMDEWSGFVGLVSLPSASSTTPFTSASTQAVAASFKSATLVGSKGNYWSGPGDPHGLAVWAQAVGSTPYGVLVSSGGAEVAWVDLNKFEAKGDLTSDPTTVRYFQTHP